MVSPSGSGRFQQKPTELRIDARGYNLHILEQRHVKSDSLPMSRAPLSFKVPRPDSSHHAGHPPSCFTTVARWICLKRVGSSRFIKSASGVRTNASTSGVTMAVYLVSDWQ